MYNQFHITSSSIRSLCSTRDVFRNDDDSWMKNQEQKTMQSGTHYSMKPFFYFLLETNAPITRKYYLLTYMRIMQFPTSSFRHQLISATLFVILECQLKFRKKSNKQPHLFKIGPMFQKFGIKKQAKLIGVFQPGC